MVFQNPEVDEDFLHSIFRNAIRNSNLCVFDFFIRHNINISRPFEDNFRIVQAVSESQREGKSYIETKFTDVAVDNLLTMIELARKFGGEVDLRKGKFVAISTDPVKIRNLELMKSELVKRGAVSSEKPAE
ncbi:MAG: hypothetical protein LBJ13_02300 [Puniceicoccales bacterium]|nr:hypothetical protein [Puniceicoccales bacterium]